MNGNCREDKYELCTDAIVLSKKLTKAINDIRNGEPERAVCEKYGFSLRFIRRFIFNEYAVEKTKVECKEDILLSGEERLYKYITNCKYVPFDADKTIKMCMNRSKLTYTEKQVLHMHFLGRNDTRSNC